MQSQTRKLFAVTIYKRDQQHIIALKTESFEQARKEWSDLVNSWTRAIKEQNPFILDNSFTATAFDPGLIFEITIDATEITMPTTSANPYVQTMRDKGFTESFGRYANKTEPTTQGNDILDRGFKI